MLTLEQVKDNPKSSLSKDYKLRVVKALLEYCAGYPSQERAAKSLKGVSAANITQMKQGNWELITDDYWRNTAAQIGFKEFEWPIVPTASLTKLTRVFNDAAAYSENFTIIGPKGSGKSIACAKYAKEHPAAFHVVCIDLWTVDDFLKALLKVLGLEPGKLKRMERIELICETLCKMQNPILFLDEGHNMNRHIRKFLKCLVNMTEGHCAIVRLGTNELKLQIEEDIKENKNGGAEVDSRFPSIIHIEPLQLADVKLMCNANGIEGNEVKDIHGKTEGDGRKVKRKMLAVLRSAAEEQPLTLLN